MEEENTSVLGAGKQAQKHKMALKELRDKAKSECKKVKDKNEKKKIEEKYANLEAQLTAAYESQTQGQSDTKNNDTHTNANIKDTDEIDTHTHTHTHTDNSSDENITNCKTTKKHFYQMQQKEISKTQKKKNKKQEKQKEQLDEMKRKFEGLPNLTAQEADVLNERFKILGFKIMDVPADGHCLYRAIQHQLDIQNLSPKSAALTDSAKCDFRSLRKTAADVIREDAELQRLVEAVCEQGVDAYCAGVCGDAWGGEIELAALSKFFTCPIKVHHFEDFDDVLYGKDFISANTSTLNLSFHRHLLNSGAHYNSLIQKAD